MNLKVVSISKVDNVYVVWVSRAVTETNFVDDKPVTEIVSNEFAVYLPIDKVEGATRVVFREALRAAVAASIKPVTSSIPAVASAEIGKTFNV